MRAKQQDLLQQIEDLVKEGKHDPYLVPMSIVRCALAAACSASRQQLCMPVDPIRRISGHLYVNHT